MMKIKFIGHAKKWFDKYNGNTYHSVRIIRIRDKAVLKCDWTYGYGTQYKVTAKDKMVENKWIPNVRTYERDNDYPIYWIDEGHGLKRDMVMWGK